MDKKSSFLRFYYRNTENIEKSYIKKAYYIILTNY